jgi:hypothetical protein
VPRASSKDGFDRLKGHTHRGLQNPQETGINLQEMNGPLLTGTDFGGANPCVEER